MKKLLILLITFAFVLILPACAAFAEAAQPPAPAVDLTPIFQALIALLASLITAKVIPYIKSKTSKDQLSAMLATVKILVYAAEQLYGAGQGDQKLAYVEKALQAQGYKLDTQLIKEMIESQVHELTLDQVTVGAKDTTT